MNTKGIADWPDEGPTDRQRFAMGFRDGELEASWGAPARDMSKHFDGTYAAGYRIGHASRLDKPSSRRDVGLAWRAYSASQRLGGQGPACVVDQLEQALARQRALAFRLERLRRRYGRGYALIRVMREVAPAIAQSRAEVSALAARTGMEECHLRELLERLGGAVDFRYFGAGSEMPDSRRMPVRRRLTLAD